MIYYHRKFFGSLVFRGKKLFAHNLFSSIKYRLKLNEGFDPFYIFLISMIRLTPSIFFIYKRMGRLKLGIPLPIKEHKQFVPAIKWVVKLLKDKNRIITTTDTVDLLISSIHFKSLATKKKMEYQKTAVKNRYLLRYLK